MMGNFGAKPEWLTFDCYGTLIQWDEGLIDAATRILARSPGDLVPPDRLLRVYDRIEHELENGAEYLPFRTIAARALESAMRELQLPYLSTDAAQLTDAISSMPPFPEVVPALSQLKQMGFKLCIISNTDDDIIAGNVAQLGGHIDRVVTAQQARAYKPAARIFQHAHAELGIAPDTVIHVCASPMLDLQACRDGGFRCVWIDRHTIRRPLPDYTPDAIFDRLDRVPVLFKQLGW